MWRPKVLRCLIALNWTVAGVSSAQVMHFQPYLWHGESYRWAHRQLAQDAPDLEIGSKEHWQRSTALSDEYKAKTLAMANCGWWGWWAAMMCGGATAVGLMVVFPGVEAKFRIHAEPA